MAPVASRTKQTTGAAMAGRTREGVMKAVIQQDNQEVSGVPEPPRAEQKADAEMEAQLEAHGGPTMAGCTLA